MSRPSDGRGIVVGLVGLLALALGGLALWLTMQDEAPSQVPDPGPPARPAQPSLAELAAPTEASYMAVPSEAPDPPKPALPPALEQQRDTSTRMRSELRESLGTKDGTPSSRPRDGAAVEPPALDKDYIRDRIREDLVPVAVDCYESVLADQPEAGGKIVMRFAILGDPDVGGVVDEASVDPLQSDFDSAFLRDCMTESLMAVHFDAPPEGGRVEVTYPFVFEPGEDE